MSNSYAQLDSVLHRSGEVIKVDAGRGPGTEWGSPHRIQVQGELGDNWSCPWESPGPQNWANSRCNSEWVEDVINT